MSSFAPMCISFELIYRHLSVLIQVVWMFPHAEIVTWTLHLIFTFNPSEFITSFEVLKLLQFVFMRTGGNYSQFLINVELCFQKSTCS